MGRFLGVDPPDLRGVAVEAVRAAGTTKAVAIMTGRSPKTVEKWRAGETEMSASALLKLMLRSREAARVLLQGLGFNDAQMDAEQARLLDELVEIRAHRAAEGRPEGVALRIAARALAGAKTLTSDP